MIRKIGITGGIGSGKSTVAEIFATYGVPVYCDDVVADKEISNGDPEVVKSIKKEFGEDMYIDGKLLNRRALADIVFKDPAKLKILDAIFKPVLNKKWNEWVEKQTYPYVIREAAIFFENEIEREMDAIIGVRAPEETRILRVMKRNSITREQVLERMRSQMDEAEKLRRCDIIIDNDGSSLGVQVEKLHEIFMIESKPYDEKIADYEKAKTEYYNSLRILRKASDGFVYVTRLRSYGSVTTEEHKNSYTVQELCNQYDGEEGIVDVYTNNPDSKVETYGKLSVVSIDELSGHLEGEISMGHAVTNWLAAGLGR